MRTPKGFILALLGLIFIGFYLGSLFIGQMAERKDRNTTTASVEQILILTQCGTFVLFFIHMVSSLSFRGLYIPQEEIEKLFSAPLSRASIIRYRMMTNFARSLFGGIIFGIIISNRVPVPAYGFMGAFVVIQTLPVLGQMVSVLAGDAENRMLARIPKWGFKLFNVVGAITVILIIGILFMPRRRALRDLLQTLVNEGGDGMLQNPVVQWITIPMRPWATMITAPTASVFLPWLAFSLLLWFLLFYLAGKLPVDFRELSLETAADVAKRLKRARRGSGVGGVVVSQKSIGRRAPWIFGRGVMGAIAWRKSMSIVRKATGSVVTLLIIGIVLTVGGSLAIPSTTTAEPAIILVITFVGSLYLSNILRLDFREDVDRMEHLKTCPAKPWQVFVANILPQTLLVSIVMYLMQAARMFTVGRVDPSLAIAIPATPLLLFILIAVDNMMFLISPARTVAGQDTMLQNSGRLLLLLLIRIIVWLVVLGVSLLPGVAIAVALNFIPAVPIWARVTGIALAIAFGFGIGAAFAVLFARLGGLALRQFDVAADRV